MNKLVFKTCLLKGEAGNNIESIEKTATSGLTDTYTITLTDGTTSTFEVTNGSTVDHIDRTGIYETYDEYTMYMTDGTSATFEVPHGPNGTFENFAVVEPNNTASRAYVKGQFLVYNGRLCVVTAAIASGNTLAIGTNIAQTDVGTQLYALSKSYTVRKFTSSTTWTVPNGVEQVDAYLVSGGQGGGGSGRYNEEKHSGAGGRIIYYPSLKVTGGQTIPIVIGAGGQGGASGYNDGTLGGDTTFGALTTAFPFSTTKPSDSKFQGGVYKQSIDSITFNWQICPLDGKYYGIPGAGAGAGTGSASYSGNKGGDVTLTGKVGGNGAKAGGGGGASADANGGNASGNTGGKGANAAPNTGNGGGAGGSGGTTSGVGGAGGDGGSGIVIIGYYA